MKKMLIFIFTLVLFLFLVSCNEGTTSSDAFTTIMTQDNSDFITIFPQIEDARPENGIIEDYYADDAIDLNIVDHLSLYAESDTSSDEFKELYNNAEDISLIPVYGMYLENTSLAVCLFRKEDELLGTKTIHVFEEDGMTQIAEFTSIIGDTSARNPLSDRQCFLAISSSQADYPSFELLGMVYYAIGYKITYPIGILDGEEYIKFYNGSASNFGWVEPFSTVDEGRDKFNMYWNIRTSIINSIPTFPWKTEVLYEQGYINKYKHQDVFTMGETPVDNLYDYETVIAIPLLDENGEENVYVLHLLYIQNYLIGEVILKNQDGIYTSVSAVYAEKTVTGGYIPLLGINYVDTVKDLLAGGDQTQVVGIGFDGSKYCLILADIGS
ncbi:MAG TPA: hypothetical protein HA367_08245 [Candidatus Methanofastidiosum sp.]|nr:hypothetical protein [Methanofastidiosum sp.]